jgi:hypothetical protein
MITSVGTNLVTRTIGGVAGSNGSTDGAGSTARFGHPSGIATDGAGNLYLADSANNTIRQGALAPAFQLLSQTNGSITFTWNTLPGQKYQPQYSSSPGSTDWSNLSDAITATNASISATDTPGVDRQRFYRIKLLP